MKKVCIVGFTSLVSNPRLVKEADALYGAGYDVTVLCVRNSVQNHIRDQKLLKDKKWKCIHLDVCKDNLEGYLRWLESGIKKTLGIFFSKFTKTLFARWTVSIYYRPLLNLALKTRADIYIGHVTALPVVVEASKKTGSKVGYDVEDFHSAENENSNFVDKFQDCIVYLEEKYLKECDYITSSSPLISKALEEKYDVASTVILNVFEKKLVRSDQVSKMDYLSLYWFSQWIGPDRGIEDVVRAMALSSSNIKVYLQGNIKSEYKKQLLDLIDNLNVSRERIIFLDPCEPDELVSIGSKYDVGLALEHSSPLNRDICLTNKLFTYLLSGLSIIATDTSAQKLISKDLGIAMWNYSEGDIVSLANRFDLLSSNKDLLIESKKKSLELAKDRYNWDLEKEKFLVIVSDKISENI